MIERVTDLVKEILIRDKDIDLAVDMTAGNGNDSAFILDVLGAKELVLLIFKRQLGKIP